MHAMKNFNQQKPYFNLFSIDTQNEYCLVKIDLKFRFSVYINDVI